MKLKRLYELVMQSYPELPKVRFSHLRDREFLVTLPAREMSELQQEIRKEMAYTMRENHGIPEIPNRYKFRRLEFFGGKLILQEGAVFKIDQTVEATK